MTASPLAETPPDFAVDVVIESDAWQALPDAEAIVHRAIALAAAAGVMTNHPGTEVSVMLCDDATIAGLNARWRAAQHADHQNGAPSAQIAHSRHLAL